MIINIINVKIVISFETPVIPRPSLRNIRIACSIARNVLQLQRLQRRVFAEACKIFELSTRVIRGRNVKPASGNLHAGLWKYIKPELAFTMSVIYFLSSKPNLSLE